MRKRIKLYARCFFNILHIAFVKIFNMRSFSAGILQDFSLGTRIAVGKNSKMVIGKKIHTMGRVILETVEGGTLEVGDGCVINTGCMIVSMDKISIGKKTGIAPNVIIYDHDHNTDRSEENEHSYKTSPVTIGDWVWIGANSVILRGSVIGDGCVIGAGSVIKGTYPPGTVVIQKRSDELRKTAANPKMKGGEKVGKEKHTGLEGVAYSA